MDSSSTQLKISEAVTKQAIKIFCWSLAIFLTLLIPLFLSFFFYTKSNQIAQKLAIDSQLLSEAIQLGDQFFLRRYMSSLTGSSEVKQFNIKSLDGQQWVLPTQPSAPELDHAPVFSFQKKGSTLIVATDILSEPLQVQWKSYVQLFIPHKLLLWPLSLALILALIGSLTFYKALLLTGQSITNPVLNLSMDMENNSSWRSASFLETYKSGTRFRELDQLTDALTSMLTTIDRQNTKLSELEVLEALHSLSRQVAHDINSPLGAVRVVAENLRGMNIPETKLLEKAVLRLTDITSDLQLKNSKLAMGFEQDRPVPYDWNLFVSESVEEKSVELQNSNVSIEFRELLSPQKVLIKAKSMARALSNILNNAVESFQGKPGNVVVEVYTKDDWAGVRIIDQGCGISKSNLPKVFAKNFTFGKKTGSGLGLSYANQIVKSSGGELNLISSLNHGTTVDLMISKKTL